MFDSYNMNDRLNNQSYLSQNLKVDQLPLHPYMMKKSDYVNCREANSLRESTLFVAE